MANQATSALQGLSLSADANPLANDLPVTLTRSCDILGVETDCWVQLFSDQIVIGVSQLGGKVGTFITAQVEETAIDNKTRFQIDTVLGKGEEYEVYARRITDQIASMRPSRTDTVPPVLLGISLTTSSSSNDVDRFTEIVAMLVNLYKEAIQKVSR